MWFRYRRLRYRILSSISCVRHSISGCQGSRWEPEPEAQRGPASESPVSDMAPSGNPRKFRHGIYLVYTMYILLAFVFLVYTRYMTGNCFLEKSIFVYCGMHVWMKWLLPKYTIHRALDGDLFSDSYIELNISMVYDRHLLSIHLVYTTFVHVLVLSE